MELVKIMEELNSEYFEGEVKVEEISWFKKPCEKMGVCHRYLRAIDNSLAKITIEIDKILEETPRMLRFVIYHELCHAWCYAHGSSGHNKDFKKLMRIYQDKNKDYYSYLDLARHLFLIGEVDAEFFKELGYHIDEDGDLEVLPSSSPPHPPHHHDPRCNVNDNEFGYANGF